MGEYRQVRPLPGAAHTHSNLDTDIGLRVAVFLDQTSRPTLPDILFRRIASQLARDEAADFPRRYQIGNVAGHIIDLPNPRTSHAFLDGIAKFLEPCLALVTSSGPFASTRPVRPTE